MEFDAFLGSAHLKVCVLWNSGCSSCVGYCGNSDKKLVCNKVHFQWAEYSQVRQMCDDWFFFFWLRISSISLILFLSVKAWNGIEIPINVYIDRLFLKYHYYSFIIFAFTSFYRQLLGILISFLRRTVKIRWVFGVVHFKCLWEMRVVLYFILPQGVWQGVSFAVAYTSFACVFGNWLMLCDIRNAVLNQTLELFRCRSCFQLVPSVPKRTGNRQFFSWRNQFL